MRVVAVFDDLLLGSNVLGMLRAGGHEATLSGADAHPDGADALVVDLASTGFDGVALVERLRATGELEGTKTLGVYSHVALDSLMHADIRPFAPFSQANPLYQLVSLSTLHLGCVLAGAGGLLLLGLRLLARRQ